MRRATELFRVATRELDSTGAGWTLRDLRTVVILRRQLSQELPRQRPWLRLPRWPAAVGWRRLRM